MATVFSTATLGLQVDTREFNRQLEASETLTVRALQEMQQQATAFNNRWTEMTRGIKDTKRIISGILISRAFYTVMNGLVGAASAGLEFASSMEQAAVSLEYFVDAAAGTKLAATQVNAYLREVNEFAARTPFSTNDVLSLSKYLQSVGVSMSQTQSVLKVLTDAAAATGASTEQLERISFALGQILTKGRLANEEIRQLANANIPIYDILQEEMGLTGKQISNIGKYWVNASDSVVAILNGLEKRYQGASDRIADTFGGITDTIVDDAKIIANEAFGGLYDTMVSKLGTVRDTFNEWRDIVNEFGALGLARHLALEIDPSGEFLEDALDVIGHLKNLKESVVELYHTAQPLLSAFGRAFPQYFKIAIGTLTGFVRVSEQVIAFLEKLEYSGISVVDVFAQFYVVYQSAKFVSLLGQAASAAAVSTIGAAQAITSLLPASLSAQSGVVGLTTTVMGLVGALAMVGFLLSTVSSSFSGLIGGRAGFEVAYNDYAKQMTEYNAAIEEYRQKYRESYKDLSTGEPIKIDDSSSSKKKKGSTKEPTTKEWVAAFDEVYDIPNEDEITGGSSIADVVTQLGDIFGLLSGFKFPNWDKLFLEKPVMPELFGPDLLNGDALKISWKNFLPALILGASASLGSIFKESIGKIKGIDPGTVAKPTADVAEAITPAAVKAAADILENIGSYDTKYFKHTGKYITSGNPGDLVAAGDVTKQVIDKTKQFKELISSGVVDALPEAQQKIVKSAASIYDEYIKRRAGNLRQQVEYIEAFLNDTSRVSKMTVAERTATVERLEKLRKEQLKLGGGVVDGAEKTFEDLLGEYRVKFGEFVDDLTSTDFTMGRYLDKWRLYPVEVMQPFLEKFGDLSTMHDLLVDANVLNADDAYESLYAALKQAFGSASDNVSKTVELLNRANALIIASADNKVTGVPDLLTKLSDAERKSVENLYSAFGNTRLGISGDWRNAKANAQAALAERAARKAAEIERSRLAAEQAAAAHARAIEELQAETLQAARAGYEQQSYKLISDINQLMAAYETTGAPDYAVLGARYNVDPEELRNAIISLDGLSTDYSELLGQLADVENALKAYGEAADTNSDLYKLLVYRYRAGELYGQVEAAVKGGGLSADYLNDLRESAARFLNSSAATMDGMTDSYPDIVANGFNKAYGLPERTKDIEAIREELEDLMDMLRKRSDWAKVQTSDYSGTVIKDVLKKLEAYEDLQFQLVRTANEIRELSSIASPILRTKGITDILDPNSIETSVPLADELLKRSAAWRFSAQSMLPGLYEPVEEAFVAVQTYIGSLDPTVKAALRSIGRATDALMLTGTSAVFASKGLTSFGETLPNQVAKMLGGQYSTQLAMAAGEQAQLAADLGVAFEDIIRLSGAKGFSDMGLFLHGPGKAAVDGAPLIIQNDAAVTGLQRMLGLPYDQAFVDVKLFSDKVVQAIVNSAEETGKGFLTLDGRILELIGRDKLMYQMMAQGYAAGSFDGETLHNWMLLMSRDVDMANYVSDPQRFLADLRRYISGAGPGVVSNAEFDALGGRIFSEDAIRAFRKVTGSAATVDDYRRAVIEQMLADNTSLTLEDINKATFKIQIGFDGDFLRQTDLLGKVNSTHDMLKTYALLADLPDANKLLHSFTTLANDPLQELLSLDLVSAPHHYTAASRGLNNWAAALLGREGPALGIGDGAVITQYIDNAVISYRGSIAAGKDPLEASKLFKAKLQPLINGAQSLLDGAMFTGDVAELFGRLADASPEGLTYFKEAVEKLYSQPDMLQEATRLIKSVNGQLNRLALDIAAGNVDIGWSVNALLNDYRKMVDFLNLTSDRTALQLSDALQSIQTYVKSGIPVPTRFIEQLKMPFSVAGGADSMPGLIAEVRRAIEAGELTLTDDVASSLEQIFSNYDVSGEAANALNERAMQLHQSRLTGTRVLGMDIETVGLGGVGRPPAVTQMAVADLDTGELYESLINQGSEGLNRSALNAMLNIMDEKTGQLSDVSRAWAAYVQEMGGFDATVRAMNAAPSIDDYIAEVLARFGTGNTVIGYNAVGAGAFDMRVLRQLASLDDNAFVEGYDLMSQVTSKIEQHLGVAPRLKQSEVYQMLTGIDTTDLAHTAGYDTATLTRTIYQAAKNGTLDDMLRYIANDSTFSQTLFAGTPAEFTRLNADSVRNALTGGAAQWRNAIGPVPPEPVIPLNMGGSTRLDPAAAAAGREAIDQPLDPDALRRAAEELNEAFGGGQEAFEDLLDSARPTKFSQLLDAVKDKFDDMRYAVGDFSFEDVVKGIKGGVKDASKWIKENNPFVQFFKAREFADMDMSTAYRAYQEAFARYQDFSEKLSEVTRQSLASGGDFTAAAEEFIEQNADVLNAYKQASTNVYRTMITEIGQGLKDGGGDISSDLASYFAKLRDTSAAAAATGAAQPRYYGLYYDQLTGQVRTIGDQLELAGDELMDSIVQITMGNGKAVKDLDGTFRIFSGTASKAEKSAVALQNLQNLFGETGMLTDNQIVEAYNSLIAAVKNGGSVDDAVQELNAAVVSKMAVYLDQTQQAAFSEKVLKSMGVISGTADQAETWDVAFDSLKRVLAKTTFGTSDEVTVAFSKLSKAISSDGAGLVDATSELRTALGKAGGDLSEEALDALSAFAKNMDAGTLTPEMLANLKAAYQKTLGDFAVVVNASTGDLEFAGETAAKVFGEAADDVADGLKGFLKSVDKATYGTLSWFDVIAAVVETSMRAYTNSQYRNYATSAVADSVSSNTRIALGAAGANTTDILGSAVYTGVSEALMKSVAVTGLSTGMAMLTGSIVKALGVFGSSTGPVGWLATGAAILTSIGANMFAEKTGYNNAENTYYNEYVKALGKGEFVDKKALESALSNTLNPLTGAMYTGDEIKQMVDEVNNTARMQYDREILDKLDSKSMWEVGKYNTILHGTQAGNSALLDTRITANDTVRVAKAMGLLDGVGLGSQNIVTNYGYGASAMQGYLTAWSESDLEYFRKLLGNENLRFETEGATSGVVVDENNKRIVYSDAKGNELAEVYQMIKEQRALSGELVTEFMKTIQDTPELYRAYTLDVGLDTLGIDLSTITNAAEREAAMYRAQSIGTGIAFSQYNLDEVLKAFNEVAGTEYTRSMLETNPALAKDLTDITGQAMSRFIEKNNALVNMGNGSENTKYFDFTNNQRNADGSWNWKGSTVEQVSFAIPDISQQSVGYLNEMLNTFGFNLEAASKQLSDGTTFDFATLTSDEAKLIESLQGVIVDTAAWASSLGDSTFSLNSLTVSASDAEILASAGIKIYGNGDVAYAFDQTNHTDRTGAGRVSSNFTVDENGIIQELSKNVLTAMGKQGVSFSAMQDASGAYTGKVAVDLDLGKIQQDYTAAYFKMTSDILASVGDTGSEMRKALANLGEITEDGYMKITNKAVLSGASTIKSIITSTTGAWDALSPEVQRAIDNLDELIAHGNAEINAQLGITGKDIVQNITTFADAITIISPLKQAQLTTEIEEAFNALGITFTEKAGIFYMNIDKTGEFYQNNMSLISVDTWNRLSEDLQLNLENLGVKATQIGNQICVDLSGVMSEGADFIVAAFVDKPELWDQIPETFRNQLTEAGIITDDQLLVIKQSMETRTNEMLAGWILSWSELAPTAKTALDDAGIDTDKGLAQIVEIIDGSEIAETIEGTVVIPFEMLPTELQQALEAAGQSVEGKKVRLTSATAEAMGGMKTELATVISAFGSGTDEIAGNIEKLVDSFMQLKAIESNLKKGEYITGWKRDNDGTLILDVKKDGLFGGSSATITANNSAITRTNTKATGGITSGLTLTGEKGRELAIFPNGQISLLGTNGAELGDMPAGTRILNNHDTETVLRYNGSISGLTQYASGNTSLSIGSDDTKELLARIYTVNSSISSNIAAVRSSLATGFMPANTWQLGAAIGAMNGVGAQPHSGYDMDSIGNMVSAVTQRVLDNVLPMLNSDQYSEAQPTPVYVGTLIADDAGLRNLERKLFAIRQADSVRRGR